MKKKIVTSLILFVIILSCISIKVNASLSCNLSLNTIKKEYSKKEQVTVDVSLSNIQTQNGIIAFSAVLKYDKDSLKLVDMTGQNKWSNPSYNEDNGKLVMDRSELLTNDATILKITFEVLESSKENVTIELANAYIANGVDQPFAITSVTTGITVKNTDSNSENNTDNNEGNTTNPGTSTGSGTTVSGTTSGGTTSGGTTGSTAKTPTPKPTDKSTATVAKLPQTGIETLPVVIIVSIIVLSGIAVVSYIKMKSL